MPLSRLLYTSECTIDGSPKERSLLVRNLAESSSASNRKAGVTGSLVFIENNFIQVLEGRGPDIEDIFEHICCDFRHRDVQLIDFSPVRERLFEQWGMALIGDGTNDAGSIDEELLRIRSLVGVNAQAAVNEMRSLLN